MPKIRTSPLPSRASPRTRGAWLAIVATAGMLVLAACAGSIPLLPDPDPTPTPTPRSMSISPSSASIATGTDIALRADVEGIEASEIVWEATDGELAVDGFTAIYSAPDQTGSHEVTIRLDDGSSLTARSTIDVAGGLTDAFTMVVLPDTQNMVKNEETAPLVFAMTDWIATHAEDLDIAFVTHVGDIVAFADRPPEWERAVGALSALDGRVPYSVALGDHEYVIEENKGTSVEAYLAHFGPERYEAYDWYGGAAPNGLSHYQVFEAGGREFLHIALEWEPPGPVEDPTSPLGWARTILEAHPDLPTILTTHAYLWDKPGAEGRFPDGSREGYVVQDGETVIVGSSGETIYQTLVHDHPQVFMVVNGHYHKRPTGDPANGEYHQVSTNAAGLPVYEMLSNYQSWPNGGDGWLRILRFAPGGGANGLDRIDVETYSPPLDQYQTDALSSFSFDLSFAERFASQVSTAAAQGAR